MPTPKPTLLGERLKKELRQRGWTQQQLADAHEDLAASTVSRVITGAVRPPDLTTLDALSKVLGIPVEELVRLALIDFTGTDRSINVRDDDSLRVAALASAFPWLTPIVEELAQFSEQDRSWILAILDARRRFGSPTD